jgi:hypothetical protein
LLGGGLGVGVLLLALLGMWAGGVFKVKTKDGTIVLENLPVDAEVLVDGETVTLKAGDGKTIAITAGTKHQLQVKKEGFKVFGKEVEIDAGGRQAIRVSLQPEFAAGKPPPSAPKRVAEDNGFVSLFNGKDLTGWKLSDDGNMADWGVDDGILHTSGHGRSWLLSDKEYGDFELRLDFKLSEKGNSGVALHSARKGNPAVVGMEIQLLDDSWYKKNFKDLRPTQLTGAIYGSIPPSRDALKPMGEWNSLRIIANRSRVTVELNGVRITDADLDEHRDKAAKHPGLLNEYGHIGLQSHDGRVEFRKIEIKELSAAKSEAPQVAKPEAPPVVNAAAEEKSFVPLFNGKDLTGWKTHPKQPGGWAVEDGCLVGRSATQNHLFSTRGDYEDFHLKAEVRINKFGNSGIYFRGTFGLDRAPFPSGYEAQICHSFPKPNVPLTGSLRGLSNVVKPLVRPDEWFTMDVIAEGNHFIIKVNGNVTADFVDKENTYRKGHLTLQAISDTPGKTTTIVHFRKIEIKELPAPR